MPLLSNYGFIYDKAKANEVIGVSDAGDGTFYVVFDGPIYGKNAIFDLEISGHTYSVTGIPAKSRTKFYWTLGTSKDKTQVDFVDKKPVAEATEAWPTVTSSPTEVSMSAAYFVGDGETYPASTTPIYGSDWQPIEGISLSISDKAEIKTEIPKEETKTMGFQNTSTALPARPNILESEVGLVLKTHQAKQSDATPNEEGRKILAAGSLYTDETTHETGVVYQDYDLTDYPVFNISVVMAGRLLYDKVSEEAQAQFDALEKQGLHLIGKVDD